MASEEEPLGESLFSEWVSENGTSLGLKYHSDFMKGDVLHPIKTKSNYYTSGIAKAIPNIYRITSITKGTICM